MTTTTKISNWGRWGKDDQRGTLNLLTPGLIAKAAALVKRGKTYKLAIPVGPHGAVVSPSNQTSHTTTVRHDQGRKGRSIAVDVLSMHTHVSTHMDALSHFWYDGQLYNGYDAGAVTPHEGATKNSIENVWGIVGRGVLLDIASYKKLDRLPAGYAVTPADLEGCAKAEGVQVKAGDILLVRTGWLKDFVKDTSIYAPGTPGLGESCLEWLWHRDVVGVGADNSGIECRPPEKEDRWLYFHEVFIRDIGGYLMEFVWLEELARDKAHECMFVASPLRIAGGVGSPISPLAMV